MNKVYLLLGSNLGDRQAALDRAGRFLEKGVGPIIRKSACYSTAPWGKTDQPEFLNQVLVVHTNLSPEKILICLLAIEKKMGRIRQERYAPRRIDIDILFYGKQIIRQPHLTIPHPHIAERRLVLTPLNELSPAFIHPIHHKNIHQLLSICRDRLTVKKFKPG
jgi:2-amino-4-hydroxy-6-hydroxymethyldihydropteridine diphosphokinase